jgi:Raf kinase inhibitor-like YbhB/YbcL family protein
MSFTIESSKFENGAAIPAIYSCQGDDISPPLKWSGIPAGTQSLALIVHDPDVPGPDKPVRIWVHWVLYNMPPETTALAEHMISARLPTGTLEGRNDWNRTGYGGPCPPTGRHRYFFKLYALDTVLADLHKPDKDQLEKAMLGHVIAAAELVGTYQK